MYSPRLLHLCIGMTSGVLLWGCMKGKKEAENGRGRLVETRLGCLCCSPNTNGWREDRELSRHGVWKRAMLSVEVLTQLAREHWLLSESLVSCLLLFSSSESSAFACLVSSGVRLFGKGVNRCPLRNFARLFLNHTWKKTSMATFTFRLFVSDRWNTVIEQVAARCYGINSPMIHNIWIW